MKFNKIILFSILILFLILLGVVSASSDVNGSYTYYNDEFIEDSEYATNYVSNEENVNSNNKSIAVQKDVDEFDLLGLCKNEILNNSHDNVLEDMKGVAVKKNTEFSRSINLDSDIRFMFLNNDFYHGNPLRLGIKLSGDYGVIPTGNVTAICNGNVYPGIFGDYYINPPTPTSSGRNYNYYFEITNYTLGENVIEFIYSGDDEYNGCTRVDTFTSVIGKYNNSNYNESKKRSYFYKIINVNSSSSWDYNYIRFIYGKPLMIGVDFKLLDSDEKPKGNLIAVTNGNIYQGVLDDTPSFTDGGSYGYRYYFEITNYTYGKNVIEFIYSGDDEYNSCSQLIDFMPYIDSKHHGENDLSMDNSFGESLYKYFNFYNATGTLSVICNGVVNSYNLTGKEIKHEFTNYTIDYCDGASGFKLNNYTVIYTGDDIYNGFKTQFDDLFLTLDWYYSDYCGEYYADDVAEINLYLGNATGNVTFIVNGNRYNTTIVNGVAYADITNYTLGYNPVNVEYSGDSNFPHFSFYDKWGYFGFNVVPKYSIDIYSCLVQSGNINCVVVEIFDDVGLIGNSSVKLYIDGKETTLNLINGIGIYNLSQDSVDYIIVDYKGDNKYSPVSSSDFIRWTEDYIVNKDNYMFYFNQADGGKLFYWVPDGITLDIQGSIIVPKTYLNITKPINIISSTHDAFLDFNTTAGNMFGTSPGAMFAISNGGSGTNITGICFHNTQIWLENVTNVILDNIRVVVEDQQVGSGVGVTSIRSNSSYITVKNSYFYTRNNGGSSTLTLVWANHCTIDNNTIVTAGNVGNLIYETTNNVEIPEGVVINNGFHNITNNKISSSSGSIICWGIVISSGNNIIENNTIDMYGTGITGGWSGSYDDLYTHVSGRVVGNVLLGDCDMNAGGFVNNNYVSGKFNGGTGIFYNNIIIQDAKIYGGNIFNNTFKGTLTVSSSYTIDSIVYYMNSSVYNNFISGLSIYGLCNVLNNTINGDIKLHMNDHSNFNRVLINDNIINGSLVWYRGLNQHYLDVTNMSIVNNTIYGSINSLKSDSNKIINNTIVSREEYAIDLTNCRNNIVSSNIIRAKELYGNDAIKNNQNNNIVRNNCPINPYLNISADSIYVGDSLHINTVINVNVTGNLEVIVNGKLYTIKPNGNISIENLQADCYVVTVRYNGDDYFGHAEDSIIVNVFKFSPVLEISLSEVKIGGDVLVSINVSGASGNVSLIVDGEENLINLNNGVANYNIKSIGAGNHSIIAIYNGDERNEVAKASKNIILNEIFTKIDDVAIDEYLNIHATLKDEEGNPICNAIIKYVIDNQQGIVTTDLNGHFTILGQKNSKVEITYNGTNIFRSTSVSFTLDNLVPFKVACQFNVKKLTCYAIDTAAGEKGTLYKVVLKDVLGNLITNGAIQFVLNGVTYNTKTDEKGVASLQVNINKANTYTCAISYLGDVKHDASFTTVKVVVNKKKTSLTAKAKSFKVKTKTKKYTVTLKTTTKSVDGKNYFAKGKKVKLIVNKKTYIAKTNKKGKVTFKITKLNKKGKYNAVIKFAGDNTYKATTKKVKIKVK